MTTEIEEDDFYTRFKPIPGPDESIYWQWEDIPKEAISEGRVWTATQAEDDDMYEVISSGTHYVNKIGFLVTEVPWDVDYTVPVMPF